MGCNYNFTDPTYGKPCCSNVDPNASQPSPSHYTKLIHFSLPVSQISGFDPNTLQTQFQQQMAAQGHTIRYFRVSYPDTYTVQVDFDASSPPVLIVIAVILGIMAVIVYLITQLFVTVSHSPILTFGFSILMIGVAIALAAGAYIFVTRK